MGKETMAQGDKRAETYVLLTPRAKPAKVLSLFVVFFFQRPGQGDTFPANIHTHPRVPGKSLPTAGRGTRKQEE
jgi:hypothetical protein